ncbi:hypothetical protein [Methylorubrum extorquens]
MAVKFLGAGGASVTNFGPTADGKTFMGKAPAGASVAISTDNFATTVTTVTADATGLWAYTFEAPPAVGAVVSARAPVRADSTIPAAALGPSAASFTVGTSSGLLITAITGLTGDELLSSISPNDGRMTLSMDRRSLLVGLTASSVGIASYTLTTSAGRTLTIAVRVTAAASASIEAVGARTRQGVKVYQLAAGASISGANSGHFAVDANGAVTVSSAGQTAALNGGPYTFTVTGDPVITSMTIPVEAGNVLDIYDVNSTTTATAALTFCASTSKTTDWMIRPRSGTVIQGSTRDGWNLQGITFNGSVVDVNKGKNDPAQINRAATSTITGGSVTIQPRTPRTAKILGVSDASSGRALYLTGTSGLVFRDLDIECAAFSDGAYPVISGAGAVTGPNTSANTIYVRVTSTFPIFPKLVFSGCKIGAPAGTPYQRYCYGLYVAQSDEIVVEDCLFDGVYAGINNRASGFFTSRRNEIRNILMDFIQGYPNDYVSATPAFPYTESFFAVHDNVMHSPNMGVDFAGAHTDGIQIGSPSCKRDWRVSLHFNTIALDAIQTEKETQCILLKDIVNGFYIRGAVTNNIGVASTQHGMITSRADPSDRLVIDRNTFTRSTRGAPKTGNTSPFRITTEAANGPSISRNVLGLYADTTGTPNGNFTADPVPGGSASRTLAGGGTALFDNNGYISQLTPNTGAGTSMKENFAGFEDLPDSAFVSGTGWPFNIDYTSAATIAASARQIFTPIAGSRAEGRGFFSEVGAPG